MKLPFDIESGQFQGLKSRQYTITIKTWLELPWNSRGQICAIDLGGGMFARDRSVPRQGRLRPAVRSIAPGEMRAEPGAID